MGDLNRLSHFLSKLLRHEATERGLDISPGVFWDLPRQKKIYLLFFMTDEKKQLGQSWSSIYALVICNHGPQPPWGERGIAMGMSGVFTFALSPQGGGYSRILYYKGKKGSTIK